MPPPPVEGNTQGSLRQGPRPVAHGPGGEIAWLLLPCTSAMLSECLILVNSPPWCWRRRSTPRRSPRVMAGSARRAAPRTPQRRRARRPRAVGPQCGLRLTDGVVADQHDFRDARARSQTSVRRPGAAPDCRRRCRPRAHPPACLPPMPRAMSALPSGSTATIRIRPPYQAAMPPINPPPPTATSSVSMSGASCFQLHSDRALAQQGLGLVEGVNRHRAGLTTWASLAASASA